MKNKFYIIISLIFTLSITSCDFLDIVPDERPVDKDAFEDIHAAKRFMYSCYGYLPMSMDGANSLDLMTGDEVITAFEHETFAGFPKGNYTASVPVISYWNTFFQGIRQCYILLNNIDLVPGMKETVKKDYIAQAKFLIGYYHFLLARCYGPIILIKEEPSILTPASEYLPRTNYDDCITFICDLFDQAAKDLPNDRAVREYGLATAVVAKAFKAKTLLYAASPLFNGNKEFYSDFVNKDGKQMMPLDYDPAKWSKTKEAFEEAIKTAHDAGHELYTKTDFDQGNSEPEDPIQRRLRYNIIDGGNKEIIWADNRGEGRYGIQNKSLPYSASSAWNGVSPTFAMLNRFYTENGLPVEKDPNYDYDKILDIITVSESDKSKAEPGQRTLYFNMNREPRFYAWIAFQGGYYETLSDQGDGAYSSDRSYIKYEDKGKGKIVCDFILGGNCARGVIGGIRQTAYAPTGYLNKKGVSSANEVAKYLKDPIDYPWPIIRLADLYLGYAEACVETGDLEIAKEYLNKVRSRAGIPSVEESWIEIAKETLTQDILRDVVRQERMIELYLENQNFWDMRRWKLAHKYFGVKAKGLNNEPTSIEDFAVIKDVIFERNFETPTQYLLPIPIEDIQKNEHLVQNPGYANN